MLRVLTLTFALAVGTILIAPISSLSGAGDGIAPDTYQQASPCSPQIQGQGQC